MASLDDHVRRIFQGMSAYLRFFIFLHFVEGKSSQHVIVKMPLYVDHNLLDIHFRHGIACCLLAVCICSAQSENQYNSGIVPAHCENSYFVRRFRNCTGRF